MQYLSLGKHNVGVVEELSEGPTMHVRSPLQLLSLQHAIFEFEMSQELEHVPTGALELVISSFSPTITNNLVKFNHVNWRSKYYFTVYGGW